MLKLMRLRAVVAPLALALMLGLNVAPAIVHAQDGSGNSGFGGVLSSGLQQAAPEELQTGADLNTIIGNLISSVIGFLGVVLFVYLLWGGFKYMTAGGDTGQVKEATTMIRNAVIGLVIIASAYAIANFVITQLAGAIEPSSGVQ